MQLVVKLGGATLWVPACRASKDEKLLLAAGGDGSAPARPRRGRGGDEGPAAEGWAEDVQVGEVDAVSAEAARMCAGGRALVLALTARPRCRAARRMPLCRARDEARRYACRLERVPGMLVSL